MPAEKPLLTISELTRRIRSVLETDFTDVSVKGEISNFKHHSSGHFYFTLKDEGAQIAAVMWRSKNYSLYFTPQDGMKVAARGNITVYEPRGQYQIDVQQLQPLGVGELQIAFEKLKQKLAAEGLFEAARKRPIPPFPERIGIVTSPTGAAIRDMISILTRRMPSLEVILHPVRVQGPGAAEEVAQAIADFTEYGNVDVLIVGRGGGSLEDLWAFNEEIVARAIASSDIPIVSAIGHEIDFTIADFVADLRAPTPSAAVEMIVRDRRELIDIVRNFCYTAKEILEQNITSEKDSIKSLLGSYAFNRPVDLVRQFSQRVDELDRTLAKAMGHRVLMEQRNLVSLGQRLQGLNPDAVLRRGYAIVKRDGEYVTRAKVLHSGDDVKMKFYDGEVEAHVEGR